MCVFWALLVSQSHSYGQYSIVSMRTETIFLANTICQRSPFYLPERNQAKYNKLWRGRRYIVKPKKEISFSTRRFHFCYSIIIIFVSNPKNGRMAEASSMGTSSLFGLAHSLARGQRLQNQPSANQLQTKGGRPNYWTIYALQSSTNSSHR